METFNTDSLQPPRKKPPPADANGSKHCLYHCTIGHTTKLCHTLRDKIEALIRAKQLKQYVRKEHTE